MVSLWLRLGRIGRRKIQLPCSRARYRKFATALRRVERRWQNRDVTFLLLATRVKPERSRVGILADSQSNHRRPIVEIPRKHSDRKNI